MIISLKISNTWGWVISTGKKYEDKKQQQKEMETINDYMKVYSVSYMTLWLRKNISMRIVEDIYSQKSITERVAFKINSAKTL